MVVFRRSSGRSPRRIQTLVVMVAAADSADSGNDGGDGSRRTGWRWGGGGANEPGGGERDIIEMTKTTQ